VLADFLRIITVDESSLHHFDPKSNWQNVKWKHSSLTNRNFLKGFKVIHSIVFVQMASLNPLRYLHRRKCSGNCINNLEIFLKL
jgi:hypothetical protein